MSYFDFFLPALLLSSLSLRFSLYHFSSLFSISPSLSLFIPPRHQKRCLATQEELLTRRPAALLVPTQRQAKIGEICRISKREEGFKTGWLNVDIVSHVMLSLSHPVTDRFLTGKKMKDRLKKAGDIERRDASISPQSACSELDTHQLSPDLRDRGRSSGSMFHDDLVSRPQMALFPESYSEQYASVQAPAYQPYNGGYSTQSMDASSVGPQYSTLGDAFDSSYMGYSQNGSIAHQAPLNGSYSNSANQRQYHSQGASMSSSRAPLSPITSTSQGNFYSSPRGSSYSSQITSNNYGNVQVPYSHAYTESDTSVILSDFLCSSYRS